MFFSYIIKTCMILSMTEWVLGICPHLSEWICSVPSVVNGERWSPILQQAELEMPLSTHRSSTGRIKVISSCRFPNSWADNVWWSECCPKSFTGRWNAFSYLGGKRCHFDALEKLELKRNWTWGRIALNMLITLLLIVLGTAVIVIVTVFVHSQVKWECSFQNHIVAKTQIVFQLHERQIFHAPAFNNFQLGRSL